MHKWIEAGVVLVLFAGCGTGVEPVGQHSAALQCAWCDTGSQDPPTLYRTRSPAWNGRFFGIAKYKRTYSQNLATVQGFNAAGTVLGTLTYDRRTSGMSKITMVWGGARVHSDYNATTNQLAVYDEAGSQTVWGINPTTQKVTKLSKVGQWTGAPGVRTAVFAMVTFLRDVPRNYLEKLVTTGSANDMASNCDNAGFCLGGGDDGSGGNSTYPDAPANPEGYTPDPYSDPTACKSLDCSTSGGVPDSCVDPSECLPPQPMLPGSPYPDCTLNPGVPAANRCSEAQIEDLEVTCLATSLITRDLRATAAACAGLLWCGFKASGALSPCDYDLTVEDDCQMLAALNPGFDVCYCMSNGTCHD
jgi:hypothetical protein